MKKYYRRAKFAGWIFMSLPFVRCTILTGSLARGDANSESDIDLLIFVQSGRIFTSRFFVTATAFIMGIKRLNNPKKDYSGRICLNYYLADDYLKIPTGRGEKVDSYCAKNYLQAKYLAGNYSLFEKFMKVNQQLFNQYLSSRDPKGTLWLESRDLQNHGSKRFLRYGRNDNHGIIEKILSGKFGDIVESKLKSIQVRRIERDLITKKYPKLIVYNDKELRFHPPKI